MKKRIIIVIFIAFLITGCSAEYNLYITENIIKESVSVDGITSEISPISLYSDIDGFSEEGIKLDGVLYYDIIKDGNIAKTSYDFDWENYHRAGIPSLCQKSFSLFMTDNNEYVLNTSNSFSCFDLYPKLSNININITLDSKHYEVKSSNADQKNDSIFTWNITKSNYKNKNVQLIFTKKESEVIEPIPVEKEKNWLEKNVGLVLIGSLLILGIAIGVSVKFNSRKR